MSQWTWRLALAEPIKQIMKALLHHITGWFVRPAHAAFSFLFYYLLFLYVYLFIFIFKTMNLLN
jgi:hypothetical protein